MEDELERAIRGLAPPPLPPTKQQIAEYWKRFREEAEKDPMFADPPDWEEIQDADYSPAMCLNPGPNKSIRRGWPELEIAAGIVMAALLAELLWIWFSTRNGG